MCIAAWVDEHNKTRLIVCHPPGRGRVGLDGRRGLSDVGRSERPPELMSR